MKKERADRLLVDRGLAETRHKAQALIMAGRVALGPGGPRVGKAGQLVAVDALLVVETPMPFVGRGGLKLDAALDAFGVDVAGRVCADIGSSTGGFTDCFLKRGAARVYAVDVDIRQLDARLRRDPRVVTVEKNARHLEPSDFGGEKPAVAAVDVSFISVTKILPAVRDCMGGAGPWPDPAAVVLVLVKPQFEAGRGRVGRKGVVRDPEIQAAVLERIVREAGVLGLRLRGLHRAAVRGQKGNQEYFARFGLEGLHPSPADVLKWTAEVTRPS
jgi:23S rRNA (cytidine1920-2'-O)/16S rRNA (cytidine1409-2'-O)-methyltransferase